MDSFLCSFSQFSLVIVIYGNHSTRTFLSASSSEKTSHLNIHSSSNTIFNAALHQTNECGTNNSLNFCPDFRHFYFLLSFNTIVNYRPLWKFYKKDVYQHVVTKNMNERKLISLILVETFCRFDTTWYNLFLVISVINKDSVGKFPFWIGEIYSNIDAMTSLQESDRCKTVNFLKIGLFQVT